MIYQPREQGQGLVEYALILVLVAVVVIVILALLGPAIGNIFSNFRFMLIPQAWSRTNAFWPTRLFDLCP